MIASREPMKPFSSPLSLSLYSALLFVKIIKLLIAENCICSQYDTPTAFSLEIHNFAKSLYTCMGVKKENEVVVPISLAPSY